MYRFLKADLIHDGKSFRKEKVLVVKYTGEIIEFTDVSKVKPEDLEHYEGILCPGFINTHCHLELSHYSNLIPQKTGIVDFVSQIMQNRDLFSEIEKNIALLEAAENMIDQGIVAVGDICNTIDCFSYKENSKLKFVNFMEVSGFVPSTATARFHKIEELVKSIEQDFPNTSNYTIVPHAPYSTSLDLITLCQKIPSRVQTIHMQESIQEHKFIFNKDGDFLKFYEDLEIDISFFKKQECSSMEYILPMLNPECNQLFVHNTFATEEDILLAMEIIKNHAYFVLCPNANLYIEDTLPPVDMMIKHAKDFITLGTDSLASNFQLSIMSEINTLMDNCAEINLELALQFATWNGARSLAIDEQFGSFEPGKTPGVILIKGEKELERLF